MGAATWRTVPVEPTEAMLVNGREALMPLVRLDSYGPLIGVWKDMLAASPVVPVGSGEAVTVWYGIMPESNGRENWTASLRRVNSTDPWGQEFCFARSEYPDRVRYEADRMRWVLGELPERPDILAYDTDKHSGYVPPASPVVPAPEGEVVAWGCFDANGLDDKLVYRDRRRAEDAAFAFTPSLTVKPLYASPVVPVGVRERVLDELDKAWLHGQRRTPWRRDESADAILAALTGEDAATLGLSGKTQTDDRTRRDA